VGEDGGADLLLEVEDFGRDVVEDGRHDAAPCFSRGGGPTHGSLRVLHRYHTRAVVWNDGKADMIRANGLLMIAEGIRWHPI
jgi:hypothetical protein